MADSLNPLWSMGTCTYEYERD